MAYVTLPSKDLLNEYSLGGGGAYCSLHFKLKSKRKESSKIVSFCEIYWHVGIVCFLHADVPLLESSPGWKQQFVIGPCNA